MPTPCYISITGQTQGNITAGAFTADSVGNIYVQGHEDEMLVQEFQHNVIVPTDPQSGQPSGQRSHKPFIFTVALRLRYVISLLTVQLMMLFLMLFKGNRIQH